MTKRILTLAFCSWAIFICGTILQAQTPAEKLQTLSQALNLSPQQKTQLLPILEAEAPKVKAIKENPGIPPGEKAMQLRSIHEQSAPQVQSILSPQQYKEWTAIRNHELEQATQK
jgi:hypothetical protein